MQPASSSETSHTIRMNLSHIEFTTACDCSNLIISGTGIWRARASDRCTLAIHAHWGNFWGPWQHHYEHHRHKCRDRHKDRYLGARGSVASRGFTSKPSGGDEHGCSHPSGVPLLSLESLESLESRNHWSHCTKIFQVLSVLMDSVSGCIICIVCIMLKRASSLKRR